MAKNAEQANSPIDEAIDAVEADTAPSYPGPNDAPAEIPEGGLHEDRSPGSPVGQDADLDATLGRLAQILAVPAQASPLASLVVDIVSLLGHEQYKTAQAARVIDELQKRRAFAAHRAETGES